MSLLYRARVIAAAQDRAPSEDTLRFVQPEHYLPVLRGAFEAYSPQAASDGLKFVDVLCKQIDLPRPAARWKQSVHSPKEPPPQLSDRPAGDLGENVTAMSHVNAAHRSAVFRRNVAAFRHQQ